MGYLNAFGSIFKPSDSEKLNFLENHFNIGQVIKVTIVKEKESK